MPPKSAMILAAGYGKRMRPLTDSLPKPLVPLAGKPLIDHVLHRLADADVDQAVVNVHYHADKLKHHLKGWKVPKISISDERDELLDTGGGVKNALPFLANGPFFIHNSDSVWIEGTGSNLARMAKHWDQTKMDCLMLVAPTSSSVGYSGDGDFFMSADGLLSRRIPGEIAPFVFAGVSIAGHGLFANSPSGPFSLNMLWDRAIKAGRLFGVRHDGIWMHPGSPEALEEAERYFNGDV